MFSKKQEEKLGWEGCRCPKLSKTGAFLAEVGRKRNKAAQKVETITGIEYVYGCM